MEVAYLHIHFYKLIGTILAFTVFASTPINAQISDAQKAAVRLDLRQNTAYEFVVHVELGKQRFRFATFIPDFESPTEGLIRQRALMGWKGDYLFVRHQCGQAAEWRCIVDQVFTRTGDKLVHLGSVESASCKELGCRYQTETGLFSDVYDVYRVNPVTGEQDVPPLPIARRITSGKLTTDLAETWRINQASYQSSIACLDQVAKSGFTEQCPQKQSAWSALGFAAKLTHYTNRNSERESLFATQAAGYCAKSADPQCQWRVAGLKDYFQRFAPGATPIYNPSPVTLSSTTTSEPKAMQVEKLETGKAIKLKL